jgi:polysaccharide export outer membrane protein
MRIEFSKVQKRFQAYAAGFLVLLLIPVTALSSRYTIEIQDQGQPSSTGRSAAVFASEENYRIGANDVIDVQVAKWNEVSGTFAVNADGTFAMRYIGSLKAQGKTVTELATEIANRLRGEYVKDPQVTVSVKQYNSRTFFVQGAVRSPGMFTVIGKPVLMTLINLAGGLNVEHGSTAFIIRKIHNPESSVKPAPVGEEPSEGEGREQYELLKANLDRLYAGDFSQNLTIEPGDTVHVPPADLYFVAGEVLRPGSFPLRQGLTLRQAVSQAGGVGPKAKASAAFILRQNPSGGEPVKMEVDIADIMKADKPDVPIQPNDYVFVPSSKLKSVGNVLLNGFGMNFIRVPWVN